MDNKIYVFNDTDRNNEEYAKHLALAAMKRHALDEVIRFIFDSCRGGHPEVSERTIDDAFDCVINCDKAALYAQRLSKDERKRMLEQVEYNRNLRKEWFKSSMLKVKE